MTLQFVVGARSLISLGVSLGDLAIILYQGRRFGNWLRASMNDQELFESITEVSSSLLKRRGLIDATRMESRWSKVGFIYEGSYMTNDSHPEIQEKQDFNDCSWLMVTIVTALDLCLPPVSIMTLLTQVFINVLGGDKEMEDSLRVQLPVNIEGWRSVGQVRGMESEISNALKNYRFSITKEAAVPQLNPAEMEEMYLFLVWLLQGESPDFRAISATTVAVADSLRKAGVHLRTRGERRYESEPMVSYVKESYRSMNFRLENHNSLFGPRDNLIIRAQQVSYPRGGPQTMIDTIPVKRDVINEMDRLWMAGSSSAESIKLRAEAKWPASSESEVNYFMEDSDESFSKKFDPGFDIMLRAFPRASESIQEDLERLVQGVPSERISWLNQHLGLDFLKTGISPVNPDEKCMDLYLKYQALVFGFYYKLLEQLVSLKYVPQDAYFRGIWGKGSTTFLAMCIQFGQALKGLVGVNRTHILYLLSTMFNGRLNIYSSSHSKSGLLGILGPISVLSMSLCLATDQPDEISKFAVINRPIVDLLSENEGELYPSGGSGISFTHDGPPPQDIHPHGPRKEWFIHAKMGRLVSEAQSGVVVVARCGGRPVGWFNPLAADTAFLSGAYLRKRHEKESDYTDHSTMKAFEIRDEDWQTGYVRRAVNVLGVVHSRGNSALRYAAAGFFASAGEELCIATDDIDAASGRVDLQEGGIVVA